MDSCLEVSPLHTQKKPARCVGHFLIYNVPAEFITSSDHPQQIFLSFFYLR